MQLQNLEQVEAAEDMAVHRPVDLPRAERVVASRADMVDRQADRPNLRTAVQAREVQHRAAMAALLPAPQLARTVADQPSHHTVTTLQSFQSSSFRRPKRHQPNLMGAVNRRADMAAVREVKCRADTEVNLRAAMVDNRHKAVRRRADTEVRPLVGLVREDMAEAAVAEVPHRTVKC